ncbi:MAG: helix-turn-helix transcriptional regulator [Caulobacter sp.]|nr:helix-turn-helix transcriptional regulator [Caulobacter sp.]
MADPIDIGVGARIRIRRRELGLSQSVLGVHLGLTFQQIQKYERGANRVSASMLVRIAERLECSVAYLFGEESGSAGHLDGNALARLASPGVAELVEAFTAIGNPRARAALMQLARSMADGDQGQD